MSVCARSVRIARRVKCQLNVPVADLPLFLCPGWISTSRARYRQRQPYTTSAQALLSTSPSQLSQISKVQDDRSLVTRLPPQCSGCGALSQVVDKDEAGYYNPTRRSVEEYIGVGTARHFEEHAIVQKSLQAAASIGPEILSQLGFADENSQPGRRASTFEMLN